ncbi:unnamed protein product [Prorocentrum cordatum]|uniref:Uncharacterized protein n=1 Tax=Prorocentrum cordatum TaxID=2364126 RepID=A0ABN9PRD8_9DINO|nr:unnamed protein product [Polarella glacialis]
MCGPYDHDRREAALETEQQQLLGGRSAGSSAVVEVATEMATESNSAVADQGSEGSAGSSAVVEVATERAAESNVAVADQGLEDPNCPQWCFIRGCPGDRAAAAPRRALRGILRRRGGGHRAGSRL